MSGTPALLLQPWPPSPPAVAVLSSSARRLLPSRAAADGGVGGVSAVRSEVDSLCCASAPREVLRALSGRGTHDTLDSRQRETVLLLCVARQKDNSTAEGE